MNKAYQSHIEQWSKVLDFEIGSQAINELILRSKFKNHPHYPADKEGHIMLQHHGQKVYYRNVRVKRL